MSSYSVNVPPVVSSARDPSTRFISPFSTLLESGDRDKELFCLEFSFGGVRINGLFFYWSARRVTYRNKYDSRRGRKIIG